jgi:hypothetical protein
LLELMDDISSYIKYIIIAAILAFRFFISGKKKEQSSNKQTKPMEKTGTANSTGPRGDILRKLSGDSAILVSEPRSAANTKGSRVELEDRQYDFNSKEGYRVDPAEVNADSQKLQGLGRIQLEEEYGDVNFDVRQAIIAEAILTRPQY